MLLPATVRSVPGYRHRWRLPVAGCSQVATWSHRCHVAWSGQPALRCH